MVKIRADYRFTSKTFRVPNYPWVFEKNSKNYRNLQLGIIKMFIGANHYLQKYISLTKETNKLIDKELKEDY